MILTLPLPSLPVAELMRSSRFRWLFCAIGMLLFSTTLSAWSAPQVNSADAQWRSAIMNDDTARLRELLQQAATPEEQVAELSHNGKSALMIACKTGDIQFVEKLLELGADEHAATATGGTPFMFASLGGHEDIVRLLHSRGVDINAQGANGWSATTIAAAKGYDGLLKSLIEMQSELNAPDVYRWTPLMRAVDNGHIDAVKVLLQAPRLSLNSQDETGNTALHHAASNANAEMLVLLLEAGIDQNIENNSGTTAAQLVTALSNSEELSALFSAD